MTVSSDVYSFPSLVSEGASPLFSTGVGSETGSVVFSGSSLVLAMVVSSKDDTFES